LAVTTRTTASEITETTIDLTQKSVIPVGSEEQLFATSGAEKKTEDGNDPATAVRHEDGGVVRIDAFPYPREPPLPVTGEP
jgi:hypothetical protein